MLVGIVFAFNNCVFAKSGSGGVEKVEGGYLYEVPGRETPETYVKYIDSLKEQLEKKKTILFWRNINRMVCNL
jgi:hypothetical protein